MDRSEDGFPSDAARCTTDRYVYSFTRLMPCAARPPQAVWQAVVEELLWRVVLGPFVGGVGKLGPSPDRHRLASHHQLPQPVLSFVQDHPVHLPW